MKIPTKFLIILPLVFAGCSNLTPGDKDLANFAKPALKPSMEDYSNGNSESLSLCNIVSKDEVASILGYTVSNENNPAFINNKSILDCRFFNPDNESEGVSAIVHLSDESQNAKNLFEQTLENNRTVLLIDLSELPGISLPAYYYSVNENTTNVDVLAENIWLNLSVSGTNPELRVQKSTEISNLIISDLVKYQKEKF